MVVEAAPWDDLQADRYQLGRVGTVERVASLLRDYILEGRCAPGTRLSEESIGRALAVSRNTLREAFRLLSHERLATHEFNRGVFVRDVSVDDLADIYRLRRLVETAAIRLFPDASPGALTDIGTAVEQGRKAAGEDDWRAVGTADLRFHRAIASIAQSDRVDELMDRVLAEMRLAFAIMPDARPFHEPYLDRNAQIHALLAEGRVEQAAAELDRYLRDAEQQLTAAFEATSLARR